MTKSKQETGFKKTLRNMLRGKPATNKDVAERQKSPVYLRRAADDLGVTSSTEGLKSGARKESNKTRPGK
jgi:hypothetical protein